MSQENIELVRNISDRFNNRDYESVLGHFGAELEWFAADHSPLADRSPYYGIDAVREGVFARIAAGFTRLNIEINEIFGAGDKVVVLGYYDGSFAVSDKALRAQLAHIWTIANGKAVKFQQYVDTYAIAEAAKMAAA